MGQPVAAADCSSFARPSWAHAPGETRTIKATIAKRVVVAPQSARLRDVIIYAFYNRRNRFSRSGQTFQDSGQKAAALLSEKEAPSMGRLLSTGRLDLSDADERRRSLLRQPVAVATVYPGAYAAIHEKLQCVRLPRLEVVCVKARCRV